MKNPEIVKKVSLKKRGKKNPKVSETQKRLYREGKLKPWNKGILCSEETKKKISIALKGKPNLKLRGKKGHPAWNKGMKNYHNKGTFQKGHIHSEEALTKIKRARARQKIPMRDSSIEVKLQNFLKRLNIDFIPHHYINIEHGYLCDIFIPSMNMVLEADGNYFHKYPVGKKIDRVRTKELIKAGFRCLRFWGRDIRKMTLNEFKSKLS